LLFNLAGRTSFQRFSVFVAKPHSFWVPFLFSALFFGPRFVFLSVKIFFSLFSLDKTAGLAADAHQFVSPLRFALQSYLWINLTRLFHTWLPFFFTVADDPNVPP